MFWSDDFSWKVQEIRAVVLRCADFISDAAFRSLVSSGLFSVFFWGKFW